MVAVNLSHESPTPCTRSSASAVQEKSKTADFFLSFALTKGAPPAPSTSSASCASVLGL